MKKWILILLFLIANNSFGNPVTLREIPRIPTTPHYFSGQNELAKTVKNTVGGFHGRVAVWEWASRSWQDMKHAEHMYDIIAESGIPHSNIEVVDTHKNQSSILKLHQFRVVNSSTTWNSYPTLSEIKWIQKNNTLFVCAAGNTGQYGHVRDLYKPESQVYASAAEIPWNYERAMQLLETGKVIIATIVEVDEGGRHHSYKSAIRAGDAKNYTFAVPLDRRTAREICTSGATARLSALAFHLAQLYGTPEEIIAVLRKTATDIGEPGVDEEFGWGVPNVNHPIILNRSKEVVLKSFLIVKKDDSTFAQLEKAVPGFSSFVTEEGGSGIVYDNKRSKLLFCTNRTKTPFGVQSSFMSTAGDCTQFAVQQTVIKVGNHNLSATGTYGYASSDDWLVRNGQVGLKHTVNPNPNLNLSLYAGYKQIWGKIGIPGHKEVGAGKTPFQKKMVEATISATMIF